MMGDNPDGTPQDIEGRIDHFWREHGTAATDPAHPDHFSRVQELTTLYHEKTGEELPTPEPAPSLADFTDKPATPEDFDIGPQSRFAQNLGPYDEWNAEGEEQARQWMSNAGMAASSGPIIAGAFAETQRDSFDHARAAETSRAMIEKAHPGNSEAAVAGMRRVITETGGQALRDWLNETGAGNHPLIVSEILRVAERKGYITRTGG